MCVCLWHNSSVKEPPIHEERWTLGGKSQGTIIYTLLSLSILLTRQQLRYATFHSLQLYLSTLWHVPTASSSSVRRSPPSSFPTVSPRSRLAATLLFRLSSRLWTWPRRQTRLSLTHRVVGNCSGLQLDSLIQVCTYVCVCMCMYWYMYEVCVFNE